jgi:cell wall-associated NlpC family hydrolase
MGPFESAAGRGSLSLFSSHSAGRISPLPTESESPSTSASAFRRPRLRALPLLVMGVAVPSIFATVALPAYAYRPADSGAGAFSTALRGGAQSLEVEASAEPASAVDRDVYGATSAAEMARRAQAAAYASYSGPSVRDLLANPPYPGYNPDKIVSIAMDYLGSPYAYGGASPAGFDCSGFTQFVFAHVGISLPHSSSAQGNMTAIAPSAAMAGDLVITDGGGHVGIYLGNGTMIHASTPATGVKISKPWGSYWFVRVGI